MKAIIPAAGFGTKLELNPTESKEMLWDIQRNEYVIDWSLKLCKAHGIDPLVITRPEKKDLNSYLEVQGIVPYVIKSSSEWSHSCLLSCFNWDDHNILIFPDARWSDTDKVIKSISYLLGKCNKELVVGTFTVDEPSKFCVVEDGVLIEKPKDRLDETEAMGTLGFTINEGYKLFNALTYSGRYSLPEQTQYVEIESYEDLTRNPSNRLIKK